jgi:hypothetical protein
MGANVLGSFKDSLQPKRSAVVQVNLNSNYEAIIEKVFPTGCEGKDIQLQLTQILHLSHLPFVRSAHER